ncbi:hypothetical protein [Saccharopolyspora cebuensis]|uniref:Small secreted hydrophilic protein n=1 Tax=Saccharopolyspora cebuensis TaxID=418759 RepID=A0ABV4CCM9_9PSEU
MDVKRPWIVASATLALAGFGTAVAVADSGGEVNDPRPAPVVQIADEQPLIPVDGSPESPDSPGESPVDSANSPNGTVTSPDRGEDSPNGSVSSPDGSADSPNSSPDGSAD